MTATAFTDADYAAFVQRVKRLAGVDLTGYKPDQMRRRLAALATRHNAPNLTAFAEVMARDPRALAAFKDTFTINVSEFLRDSTRWHDLGNHVVPALGSGGGRPLKIWSAGCSYGAEPYSLALLLSESRPVRPYTMLATDIDEQILAKAQRGAGYTESDLRGVDAARRTRCFTKQPDGSYSVKKELKTHIRYRRHDLLTGVPDREFDLIVCRNVVIYFTDSAKHELYGRLFSALRPGGVLFVGGTEILAGARDLGFEVMRTSFYRKPAAKLAGAA